MTGRSDKAFSRFHGYRRDVHHAEGARLAQPNGREKRARSQGLNDNT